MSKKICIFNIQRYSIHDGPGIRTTIFLKGCPLRCLWCCNPESFDIKPQLMWDTTKSKEVIVGEYRTIDELVAISLRDVDFYEESGGGVTLSGGDVLFQSQLATRLLARLKAKGIHTVCETSGYGKTESLVRLLEQTDLVYFDLKHYDDAKHRRGTGVSNRLILRNLKLVSETYSNLIVRIPIVPNYSNSFDDAREFGKLLKKLKTKKVELLPFHQYGENKYELLGMDYKMKGLPNLHREDLLGYKNILVSYGIEMI